jgi:hypothetical protein
MSTIKEQLAADLENLKQYNARTLSVDAIIRGKSERVSDMVDRILNDLREFQEAQRDLVNYVTTKICEVRNTNIATIESITEKLNRLEEQVSTTNRQPLTPETPFVRRIYQAQQHIGLPIVNNGLGNVINMNAVSSVAPQDTHSVEVVARPTTTNVAITSRPMNTQESSDHIVVRKPDGTSVILSSPEAQTTRTQLISEGNIPVTRAALRDEQYENYDDDDDEEYLIDDTVTTLQAELENGVIVESYCEECGEDIDVNEFPTLNKCPNCDRVVVGRSFVQA